MNKKLRVGIAGCGNISDNHFQAYDSLEDAEVIGVCDVDLGRAEQFAADRQIPHAVDSIAKLLDLEVDIISVCTPHPTHEQVVVEAAGRGVHILCEKPIAISSESARRMTSAAHEAGVKLGVLFQRRFWPAARELRAALDDGRIGQPILGSCSILLHRDSAYYSSAAWRGTWETDGGGVLMTQGIHYIDLLQWYMGDVVEVSAQIRTLVFSGEIEVEDVAVATLSFASGAVATVHATTAANPSVGARVHVIGHNGASASVSEFPEGAEGVCDLWAIPGEENHVDPFDKGLGINIPIAQINAELMPYHRLQVADFVSAVLNDTEPAVTGDEALKSLEIIAAIYESARLGKPVQPHYSSIAATVHPAAASQRT
jgi:UDP-N-acetyl-2-amino-2-deoxyglucuronate dehydrogenase